MITKQCKTKGDTPILLPIFLWTASSDCTPCTKNRWTSWVVLGFFNTAHEFLGIVLFRMTFKAWWVGGGNAILKAIGLAIWGKSILKYAKTSLTGFGTGCLSLTRPKWYLWIDISEPQVLYTTNTIHHASAAFKGGDGWNGWDGWARVAEIGWSQVTWAKSSRILMAVLCPKLEEWTVNL